MADQDNNPSKHPPDRAETPFLDDEGAEQAAERFRMAVQYLNLHKAPPVPLNYALGYFYSADPDSRLRKQMDAAFGDRKPWQHEEASDLFLRFLAPRTDKASEKIEQELLTVVVDILHSVVDVADNASKRSSKLNRYVDHLAACQDASKVKKITSEVLREVREISSESQTLANSMQTSVKEVERLKDELAHARREASSDALTGLSNRRIFDTTLGKLIAHGKPFSLIMMDIDHFKHINDEHGHVVGDRILRQLARVVSGKVRSHDCVARYSGEEFAILLPDTPHLPAMKTAESMRAAIEQLNMKRSDNGSHLGKVTASFGVSETTRRMTPKPSWRARTRHSTGPSTIEETGWNWRNSIGPTPVSFCETQIDKGPAITRKPLFYMVGRTGFEPVTN